MTGLPFFPDRECPSAPGSGSGTPTTVLGKIFFFLLRAGAAMVAASATTITITTTAMVMLLSTTAIPAIILRRIFLSNTTGTSPSPETISPPSSSRRAKSSDSGSDEPESGPRCRPGTSTSRAAGPPTWSSSRSSSTSSGSSSNHLHVPGPNSRINPSAGPGSSSDSSAAGPDTSPLPEERGSTLTSSSSSSSSAAAAAAAASSSSSSSSSFSCFLKDHRLTDLFMWRGRGGGTSVGESADSAESAPCLSGRSLPLVPPGNLGLPFIGETLRFFYENWKAGSRDAFVFSRVAKHGGVYRTHLFGSEMIGVSSPAAVKLVLTHEDDLFRVQWPRSTRRLLGREAVSMITGARHRRLRKVLGKALSPECLRQYVPRMDRVASDVVDSWLDRDRDGDRNQASSRDENGRGGGGGGGGEGRRRKGGGEAAGEDPTTGRAMSAVAAFEEIKRYAFTLACDVFVSVRPGPRLDRLSGLFERWLVGLFSLPLALPVTAFGRSLKAREELLKELQQILSERRTTAALLLPPSPPPPPSSSSSSSSSDYSSSSSSSTSSSSSSSGSNERGRNVGASTKGLVSTSSSPAEGGREGGGVGVSSSSVSMMEGSCDSLDLKSHTVKKNHGSRDAKGKGEGGGDSGEGGGDSGEGGGQEGTGRRMGDGEEVRGGGEVGRGGGGGELRGQGERKAYRESQERESASPPSRTPLPFDLLTGLIELEEEMACSTIKQAGIKSPSLSKMDEREDRRRDTGGGGEGGGGSEENSKTRDDVILDTILTLLFAGHDTSAILITWLVKCLPAHPEVLSKLREEHDAIAKQMGPDGTLTFQMITKDMSYTDKVINEGLRSNSPVPAAFRKALKDVEVDGYRIPKDSMVMVSFSPNAFNSDVFKNPHSFDPSNFDQPPPPFAFTPWGGGQRICPGNEFAKLETKIFLHHLVRKCNWFPVDPNEPLDLVHPMPRPSRGLPILVSKRVVCDESQ
ncbi:hypothetical protein CBR_g50792 [Chara braunii]|uniref:Cytochrome P450 n=1 Tax=Chara braunii TaxID=69332 RepID=A0A388K5V2_CHABU|nr:hypothetical protein CBR_g50792 [Chara braunii]|eukprot:GBG65432.1 hypothetical protein CBR_g50792 [Chara braunii]